MKITAPQIEAIRKAFPENWDEYEPEELDDDIYIELLQRTPEITHARVTSCFVDSLHDQLLSSDWMAPASPGAPDTHLAENGNPEFEFQVEAGHVAATMRSAR